MSIRFDENGYVKPYRPIEMDLNQFQDIFVFNAHRQKLFDAYLGYLDVLKEMGVGQFKQWIDGSYVTQKTFPKDIDLVNFVNFDFHRKFEHRFMLMKADLKEQGIDAYYETDYSETHKRHFLTVFQQNKWREIYGFDRDDIRKGFVQINH
jgi:hypothetical protein